MIPTDRIGKGDGRHATARKVAEAPIEELSGLFACGSPLSPGEERVLAAAAANAGAAARRTGSTPAARCGVVAIFLTEALTGLWLERNWCKASVEQLLEGAAQRMDVPLKPLSLAVARGLLRDPGLLQLPPSLAIETQLHRLVALTPVEAASVWALDSKMRPRCVMAAGATRALEEELSAATDALKPQPAVSTRERGARRESGILIARVTRWQQPHGVLAGRPQRGRARECEFLLDQGATMLGPILERETILNQGAATERRLIASSERRLERLGLDLHDRPIQDVAALADDLRLFRRQLAGALRTHRQAPLIIGRVDDLEARLVDLYGELRQLSQSLASPTLLRRPLAELLEVEAAAFRERSDATLELELTGDLESVANPQRVTLLRIVQEALANTREHSGARNVRVSVRGQRERLEAMISDDGRGFDVEVTLVSAAARGRLGLVGINERARVVGGTCEIRSSPGGPTAVLVSLPRLDQIALDEHESAGPVEAF